MGFRSTIDGWMTKITGESDQGDSNATAPASVPNTPAPASNGAQVPIPVQGQQAPEQAQEQEQVIVTGRFVPDTANMSAGDLYTASSVQTEKFRELIEKFDEDKQEPVEWVIRKGASLFCYLAPFVLAVPIGLAVGDAFVSSITSGLMSFAIHLLSVFLEVLMPILGLATTIVFKRALRDRSKIPGLISIAFFFLAVSAANAMVLLILLEKGGIATGDLATKVGIIGRSFGPLVIDLGATIYLSVSGAKSLQKYLGDQRAKIVAIRDVNQVNIELEQTQTRAAMERQAAIMDMDSKRQRQQTWNEIEKMQSQSMIENARRNMIDSGDKGERYRRGGYSGY